MRNKIKNRYFTSSSKQEKKSFRYKQKDTNFLRYKPKYSTPLRYTPKDTSEKIHICPKYLILCCYLLVSAVLLSTSISFSKYTTSTGLIVEPAKIASFAVDVQKINKSLDDLKSELSLSSTYVKDNDVMVEAFKVSNIKNEKVSEVGMECNVSLDLETKYNVTMLKDSSSGDYIMKSDDAEKIEELQKLSAKLIVVSDDGSHRIDSVNPVKLSEPQMISEPGIMPIAWPDDFNTDIEVTIKGTWNKAFTFDDSVEKEYTCIIVFDTEGFEAIDKDVTFSQPSTLADNLVVTVNQVD